MMILSITGIEKPSTTLVVAIVIIATGTAIAAFGAVSFSIRGFVFMFLSGTADAIMRAT